jgi:DNA replication protein DnaC
MVPLLIIDDLGMRKLPHTAAEDLLELIMRRYERASRLLTSNRPVDDWGKLLGDTAAVTALLDRLLHHAHVLNVDRAAGARRRMPICDQKKA